MNTGTMEARRRKGRERPKRRRARHARALSAAAILLAAYAAVGETPSTAPSFPATGPAATAPATRPVDPAKYAADRQRLADYLFSEYGKLTQSPDFVSRSIGAMLAAKLPDPRVNDFLLKLVETDKHPAVQMLAWEGLLSRSAWVTAEQHKRWIIATKLMARKEYFRGSLRASLMDVLATAPADQASVAIATDVFTQTDSRRIEDDATLEALGHAIAVWKNRLLADQLMSRLGTLGGSEKRALRALHAAGFAVSPPADAAAYVRPGFPPGAGLPSRPMPQQPTHSAASIAEMRTAVDGWKKQRLTWKSDGQPADLAWQSLSSRLLSSLPAIADIDPYDNRWYKELELGKPDLSHFDVAFVIDVSGSMAPAVGWVRREISGMMTVLGLVAREPRVGLTFFGCRGDRIGVQPNPLTSDIRKLTNMLGQVTFATGGEELVYDGLRECIRTSKWSPGDKTAKVLILVGDEPIEPRQQPDCLVLAKEAAAKGFRIYAICPRMVPSGYDELCQMGNGQAFAIQLQPTRNPPIPAFPPPATQPAALQSATQPSTTQPATQPEGDAVPAVPTGNPAETIVTAILSAAIRPEYRERVKPMVTVIMALNSMKETEPEPKR